jgi:hypothetical protein
MKFVRVVSNQAASQAEAFPLKSQPRPIPLGSFWLCETIPGTKFNHVLYVARDLLLLLDRRQKKSSAAGTAVIEIELL